MDAHNNISNFPDDFPIAGLTVKQFIELCDNAIRLLKELESAGQQASPEQQEILSRYVGWGGLPDAFDPEKLAWASEYTQLKELLTPEEYAAARSSTLNAHYTSPMVIKAIYDAVGRMGFETGNISYSNATTAGVSMKSDVVTATITECEHSGGEATCTEKAKCEICGEIGRAHV